MRQYLIYKDLPPYPSRVRVKFNAYPTFNKPWSKIREFLPSTVSEYALIMARNKPAAVLAAMRRWAE